MLGAGDIYAAGTDKPETWDMILYTGSAEYAIAMANGQPSRRHVPTSTRR